jgi:hypothetical protein
LAISAFGGLQDSKVFKRCVWRVSFYFHPDRTRSLEMSSDERCSQEEIVKVIVDLKENGPEHRWTRISKSVHKVIKKWNVSFTIPPWPVSSSHRLFLH